MDFEKVAEPVNHLALICVLKSLVLMNYCYHGLDPILVTGISGLKYLASSLMCF